MKREKELKFEKIRNYASPTMFDTIQMCKKLSQILLLGEISIPNIIVTCNNKMVFLKQEFTKAGINYDSSESSYVIEMYLEALILKGNNALKKYVETLSMSQNQIKRYLKSYKRYCLIKKHFKGLKLKPKKISMVTEEQKIKSKESLNEYQKWNEKIEQFTIKENMVEAIILYRIISQENGVQDFDDRIYTINAEMQKLGCESVTNTVKAVIEYIKK